MDLISVIVPIYNVEKYLNQCVQSIVDQIYRNLEIILVDDGSSDKCFDICNEWAAKDTRIKVLHKKNGGLSDARNAGIEIACGKYIAFVDSDDWIKPSMFQNLYKACVDFGAPIACCGRYISDQNGISKESFNGDRRCLLASEALIEIMSRKSMDVAAWDKLYLRNLFIDIRYPVGENNEDTAIFYKLIDLAEKVAHTGTSEYYYRCRYGSITQTSYKEKDRSVIFAHLDDLEKFLINKYPEAKIAYDRYKAMNIYFLMNKYIKSYGAYKGEEYILLLSEFVKYHRFFRKDPKISDKDKIIAFLILCNLYSPYLAVKKRIKLKLDLK